MLKHTFQIPECWLKILENIFLCPQSSVHCPPCTVVCLLSPVLCALSSVSFVLCCLIIYRRLSSTLHRLSSTFCRLSSVVCPGTSAYPSSSVLRRRRKDCELLESYPKDLPLETNNFRCWPDIHSRFRSLESNI